jgi:hypothetical protein
MCLIAHVIIAHIEYILAFAVHLYDALQFRWPLTISVSVEDIPSALLYCAVPDQTPLNPFGPACLDQSVTVLGLELSPDNLKTSLDDLVPKAGQALFWGFGIPWSQDEINRWIKRLLA